MTPDAPKAICGTCPFFVGGTYTDGDCRRHPPTIVADGEAGPTTAWPNIDSRATCGEHPLRQRDQLAAMAMQVAGRGWSVPGNHAPEIAIQAYRIADAMLAERVKAQG